MAWADPLRSRRWQLWAALLVLLGALFGVLVFLAGKYEETREQTALERDAQLLANELRNALLRNVQTLQSLQSNAPSPDAWPPMAAEVLDTERDMIRLEWRDNSLNVLAHRDTRYWLNLFALLPRERAQADVRQACDNAQRVSGPAYSPSYFWPMGDGLGLEMMEMCLPLVRAGQPNGFLLVSYSLQGLLAERLGKDLLRGRGLSIVEPDGTRLALHSTIPASLRNLSAQALLDLPGHTLLLRLDSPRAPAALFPNVLTAVVSALALALVAVLALLARDTRRRQRAEQHLADALAFRKAMENSLVTGLRARDMHGRVTYVNPAFCQMVGFAADELLGTALPAPWWPPELIDEYQQRMAVRLAGQVLPREGYESVFQRKDGTRFPVLIIEAPLIDAQGVQTGFMSAIIDLTEQRRAEDTNRAAQERLQASARLATMGEMASLLSHELNQPLAAIASYTTGTLNLLDEDPARAAGWSDDVRLAVRRIAEQAERAGRVIKSVSDFVRRRQSVHEAVSPTTLFEAIQPLLMLQAKKQGVRMAVSVKPGTPQVRCDRTMVEQVLLNLARNGMQAMPDGDPPLGSGLRTLRLHAEPAQPGADRAWVLFSVTDHGHGLDPDVQAQLFTPFVSTKPEGMGLGLSLCRTVVEQHGGHLQHAPASPRGTVFQFTLPAA
jgi:two-component system, LuxR family, sensor histidine kinase DctS